MTGFAIDRSGLIGYTMNRKYMLDRQYGRRDMAVSDQEVYLNAKSASAYLGISRGVFYRSVKPLLKKYHKKPSKRLLYKQADLEIYRGIEVVA